MKNLISGLCVLISFSINAQTSAVVALQSSLQDEPPVAGLRSIIGQVVSVASIDSLQLLLPDGDIVEVNLAGVQSPPADRGMAAVSRSWLNSQLHGQLVTAQCQPMDEIYHCVIFPDDRDINYLSLYNGLAICDEDTTVFQDKALYRSAEMHAREQKVGMWSAD